MQVSIPFCVLDNYSCVLSSQYYCLEIRTYYCSFYFRTSLPLVLLLVDTSVERYLWLCILGSGLTSVMLILTTHMAQHQLPLLLQLLL